MLDVYCSYGDDVNVAMKMMFNVAMVIMLL